MSGFDLATVHSPDCDALNTSLEGIRKPCNCLAWALAEKDRRIQDLEEQLSRRYGRGGPLTEQNMRLMSALKLATDAFERLGNVLTLREFATKTLAAIAEAQKEQPE